MVLKAPDKNKERLQTAIAARPSDPIYVPRGSIEDWVDRATDAGWLNPELESKGIMDVFLERHRQRFEEGFDDERDDRYQTAELAMAAVSYGTHAIVQTQMLNQGADKAAILRASDSAPVPRTWPFSAAFWKPRDRRRDLVRAAALLIAEIDRLDRAIALAQLEEKQP